MTSGASAPCAARLSLVLLETGCGSSAALRRRDDNAVGQGGRPQSTSGLAPAVLRDRHPTADGRNGAVCVTVVRIARADALAGMAHGVTGVYASALRPLCVLAFARRRVCGVNRRSLNGKSLLRVPAADVEWSPR